MQETEKNAREAVKLDLALKFLHDWKEVDSHPKIFDRPKFLEDPVAGPWVVKTGYEANAISTARKTWNRPTSKRNPPQATPQEHATVDAAVETRHSWKKGVFHYACPSDGARASSRARIRCMLCRLKGLRNDTALVCAVCQTYLCDTSSGRTCWHDYHVLDELPKLGRKARSS